jgi:hypothetical protein
MVAADGKIDYYDDWADGYNQAIKDIVKLIKRNDSR